MDINLTCDNCGLTQPIFCCIDLWTKKDGKNYCFKCSRELGVGLFESKIMTIKKKIITKIEQLKWSIKHLADESGIKYITLINFLNKDKTLSSQEIDNVLKVLANTDVFYQLKQEINLEDTDISLKIIDGLGRITLYSPVILSIYKLNDSFIYYTESKTGDLKHAFAIKEKKFIEVSLLEKLEPITEIIDYVRF